MINKLRHRMINTTVNRTMLRMSEEELLSICPPHYGPSVDYDVLNCVYDQMYDDLNQLPLHRIILNWLGVLL